MKISIINSRSKANCIVVHNDKSALVLDAGSKLENVLQKIGHSPDVEITVLITHKHLDHSRYMEEYIKRGCNVYISAEMYDEYTTKNKPKSNLHRFVANQLYSTKHWDFMPIAVEHDVPNYGFICEHDDMGEFCYFTDTHYIPVAFKTCRTFLIEANYCPDIINERLDKGLLTEFQYARVRNSHMDINETISFLNRCNSKHMENVVLVHLSDGNSDAKMFVEKVRAKLGITPIVADCNVEIEVGLGF
jgi:ribonuclease BN (tRNA processing enzyme)